MRNDQLTLGPRSMYFMATSSLEFLTFMSLATPKFPAPMSFTSSYFSIFANPNYKFSLQLKRYELRKHDNLTWRILKQRQERSQYPHKSTMRFRDLAVHKRKEVNDNWLIEIWFDEIWRQSKESTFFFLLFRIFVFSSNNKGRWWLKWRLKNLPLSWCFLFFN